MSSRLRVVVSGLIAQYPLGGVTWDYLQYVLGLARLGHDVYYLEDNGQWPYNPQEDGLDRDCAFSIGYLARVMQRYGLGDRWAYRFPHESRWFGLSELRRKEVIDSAELLIDVSFGLERPWDHRRAGRLVYVDTDPVFTQAKLARGQPDFRKFIDAHDVLFSYGERLGESDLDTGHRWHPLRKPIVLSEWATSLEPRPEFTTVMNWTSYNDVTYRGVSYGQKDVEFLRFLDLPARVAPTPLELAVGHGRTRRVPAALLEHKGWRLVDPLRVCADLDDYRRYVQTSRAEWTVAKHGYVVGRAGWFSGRSACYLAAGRPVVCQDTAFAPVIPVGEGVLVFETLEQAAAAIREVEGAWTRHARAARDLAETYFDSAKVLARLIEVALA